MILAPGATIGILGSGQLGRMLAMAALKLGLRCHIYAPESDAPAYDAASERTVAAFDDEAALARFADAVDVVTYEFENVPIGSVEFLESASRSGPARGRWRQLRTGSPKRPSFATSASPPRRFAPFPTLRRLRRPWPKSAARRCSRPCASATTARARR